MPEDGSKRFSIAGAMAVATAMTAIIGVLNQLGQVGRHEDPRPVVIVATSVAVASPAPLPAAPLSPLAQASKAAPVGRAYATPVHHKQVAHKPKPPPVEKEASNDEPAAKPSVIARATPAAVAEAAATVAPAPSPPNRAASA